jgi:hypothetical protein
VSPELASLGAAVLAQLPAGSSLELIIRLPTGGGVSIRSLEPDKPIEAIALVPETPRRQLPRPNPKPDRRAQGERLRPARAKPPTVADGIKAVVAGEPLPPLEVVDGRTGKTMPTKGPGKGRKVCPKCFESTGTRVAECVCGYLF